MERFVSLTELLDFIWFSGEACNLYLKGPLMSIGQVA